MFLKSFLLATTAMAVSVSAQDVVSVERGPNTGPLGPNVGASGFAISINGEAVAGNEDLAEQVRRQDIALERADVRVQFDGLNLDPELGLEVLDAPDRPEAGDRVRVASRLNYPAFVQRGEILIYVFDSRLGQREVGRVPIDPNGEATVVLPEGEVYLLAHRVYDARGRFDETRTVPLRLNDPENPGLTDGGRIDGTPATAEIGDMAERRRIPLTGGAVTVSGSSVGQGASVSVLGETLRPDASGRFVVRRILPPGDQPVRVSVRGGGNAPTDLERIIDIPRSEWFYVGLADLTFGKRLGDARDSSGAPLDSTYDSGRLAGFAKGRTANGWTITTRFDSGEEALSDLFDDRDDQDVASLLDRLDLDEVGYSEFGDDSELEDLAPSRGKFFFRAEREGSFVTWGDYQASISGHRFLRNERSLYGAQGLYVSPEQTSRGEAQLRFEAYASQPERLPQRDVFRGTNGSIYFLRRQNISLTSEVVTIEIRDPNTDRVLNTQRLVPGRDYDFNAVQGIVTLTRPLESTVNAGVVTTPTGTAAVNLVVQYEYTPNVGDIDGMAFGGRGETWLTDTLRVGVTGMVDRTDTADQKSLGSDLLWQFGERSFVRLDMARSEGPGFGATTSGNGGLTFTTVNPAGGDGAAYAFELDMDLEEAGAATPGRVTAYAEKRTAGFSTLDFQTTVDEELWGLGLELSPNERTTLRFAFDALDDAAGRTVRDGLVEATYQLSTRIELALGLEHTEEANPGGLATENGRRTDVAARLTFTESKDLEWYVFGQSTVSRAGGFEDNNRAGVGLDWAFADAWRVEAEISGGNRGLGGELILGYDDNEGTTAYAGYRLRPGRELSGISLVGKDDGQFVVGGTRKLTENVDLWAENTYDVFGAHRALVSGYGVEWRATERLSYSAVLEVGRVDDRVNGDVDRDAVSLGVRWQDGDDAEVRARLEWRQDAGTGTNQGQSLDSVLFTLDGGVKLSEERRLRFGFEYADIDNPGGTLASGTYMEASLGYAVRPILDDRFNMLFQYRYLRDLVGQEIDGVAGRGARQKSHVISLDVEYDLDEQWSVGGKLGGRWSETALTAGAAFSRNDAWLAVANARYHVTHQWDVLVEARHLEADQGGFGETGVLGAVYRHVGNNAKVGIGYNFGSFSDDLTDLTYDDEGIFINLIAKF